jgi:DNA polymerase
MYLGDCTRCGLCEGRTHIVFGDGSPHARLMFVGEGPGYNEDQQARPFVGKAGQLLDKMVGAMGFARDEVYIANVVKCRPPDNRDPAPDEVVACSPFLHKQIDAIQPEVIVTLGRFAAHNLLGVDTPISRMRGEWHDFKGIPVMPTWHPAYLLRNESEKRNAWTDLQAVMKRMNAGEG